MIPSVKKRLLYSSSCACQECKLFFFSNHFGISGLPMAYVYLGWAIWSHYMLFHSFLNYLKLNLPLLQLFRRMLQRCFADDQTSPNFPPIFGWTYPVTLDDTTCTKCAHVLSKSCMSNIDANKPKVLVVRSYEHCPSAFFLHMVHIYHSSL